MLLNLLANALEGAAYLILLFGLCFGSVVGIKYLNRRLRRECKRSAEDNGAEEEAAKPTSPRPSHARRSAAPAKRARRKKIYCIIERAEDPGSPAKREKASNR